MNYKVVDKEIFPITKISEITKKFQAGDFEKIHIKKLNGKYWEVRYLKSVKEVNK